MRYFINPYPDFSGSNYVVDNDKIKSLIQNYVQKILQNRNYGVNEGDLYVGSAGISFMFLKLYLSSEITRNLFPTSLQNAKTFSDHSKLFISNKVEDKASFLCGNAGIFAISSIINYLQNNMASYNEDKQNFLTGFGVLHNLNYNKYGSDEILFGRGGYLSGIYWMNQNVQNTHERIDADQILKICDVIISSGVQYSKRHNLKIPMMWECYGDKYLGAAHGICAILHMLLESPLFAGNIQHLNEKQQLIKTCIDMFHEMQSPDGNFPCVLEDAKKSDHRLNHWCHGAPGVVYLFAKAFLIFKEDKYLQSVIRAGDLMWSKGLLKKGPGLCHGVSGNGYVFLLLYRLTGDQKHLYRATAFASFLTNEAFMREARTPDHPLSLYEGIAGTVCYLIDLLQPDKASFPFMDVFDVKY